MADARRTLDAGLAYALLKRLGRVDANVRFQAEPLGGGVSSDVLLVENGPYRHVLKQPLRKFRVRDEWIVDTRRVRVEQAVTSLIETHVGAQATQHVVGFDSETEVLVTEAAETSWQPWKQRLLAGDVRPVVASAAGKLLARVHGLVDVLAGEDAFREDDLFRQQRIVPYFDATAARRPEAADRLGELSDAFFERSDFVHGDFGPKNILTNGFEARVLDHEVATRGDASFDVGFVLAHLMLKGVHRPQDQPELRDAASALWTAYQHEGDAPADEARAVAYAGAIVLARTYGKSRVEYLDEGGKKAATSLATMLLDGAAADVSSAVAAMADAAAQIGTQ